MQARIFSVMLVGIVLLAGFVVLAWGTVVSTGSAFALAKDEIQRNPVGSLVTGRLDAGMPQTAKITARDGSTVAYVNDVRFGWRRDVPLSSIAPVMIQATLAAEDRRFFNHGGVDPVGLARALVQSVGSDRIQSGASTLDMQLVRDLLLRDERDEQTLGRKVKEAIAAIHLNQRYSKAEILQAYLNTVYYGQMAYGVEAAAERYFGKTAGELTLPEAAMLAGLPQSPSGHDPRRSTEDAKRRRDHVLDLMALASFVTTDEAEEAKAEPLRLHDSLATQPPRTHWTNYIEDVIRNRFGPEALYTQGLQIESSLDPRVQQLAEQLVAGNEGVRNLARANNTSVVVIDVQTSQVLAMVGSKNFDDPSIAGQVNVSLAGRQPGSSIKPLVYLAGFERGLYPAVQVDDRRTAFSAPPGQPPYMPANYEDKYYGRVTLRDALGNSLNVPAVKTLKYVGVPALKDMARRLGITTLDSWDDRWLSLTLGGGEVRLLELTNAYAAISREGKYLPAEPFLKVTDAIGNVVYEASPQPTGRQVVDPRFAYQLLSIMGDATARQVTFGASSPLNLDRPHMVKTGTTDDYRDTWTVGCVPQVCVGVWMGNTNSAPMVKVSSSLTAGRVWVDLIQALVAEYDWPPEEFAQPDGVVIVQDSSRNGARPGGGPRKEVYLPGQVDQRVFLDMDWRAPD